MRVKEDAEIEEALALVDALQEVCHALLELLGESVDLVVWWQRLRLRLRLVEVVATHDQIVGRREQLLHIGDRVAQHLDEVLVRQVEHFGARQVLAHALIASQKDLAVILQPVVHLLDVLLKVEQAIVVLQALLLVHPEHLELTMVGQDLVDDVEYVTRRLLELHLAHLGRLRRLDRVQDGLAVVAHLSPFCLPFNVKR